MVRAYASCTGRVAALNFKTFFGALSTATNLGAFREARPVATAMFKYETYSNKVDGGNSENQRPSRPTRNGIHEGDATIATTSRPHYCYLGTPGRRPS